ncbi:hypothetical protein [Actinomadura hibisca]|uniref:hypothetical protein n=1 Tax=Actinomadura hibisca TaxID=68565 RepID=UPI000836DE92|nr:hypothetical protein [Actinomadura hibisca]
MQRKLPDLSTTQLIASGLATLAAAVGASFLGVYGTILGAAFMSVVSTAGAAVAKHYLDQGKEQIKERTHLQAALHGRETAHAAAGRATSADPTRTVAWPAEAAAGGDPNATRMDPGATRLDLPVGGDPNATRLDGGGPAEAVAGEVASGADDGAVRRAAWQAALAATLVWARQRWKVLAVSSLVIFGVVMGGITVAEKITNKPASGWVGVTQGTGTTWNNLGRSQGDTTDRDPAPSKSPDGTPSEDGDAPAPGRSSEPTGEPSRQPTGTPSTPSTGEPSTRPSDRPTTPPTSAPVTPPKTPDGGQPRPDDGQDDQEGGAGAGADTQSRQNVRPS